MRITRTPQDREFQATRKKIANRGCNVCPCCGETKSWTQYMKEGILNKGIDGGLICKAWAEGLFHTRYIRVDCYSCNTCGAEWESEPYESEPYERE